jgi:hypothetical protein
MRDEEEVTELSYLYLTRWLEAKIFAATVVTFLCQSVRDANIAREIQTNSGKPDTKLGRGSGIGTSHYLRPCQVCIWGQLRTIQDSGSSRVQ